MSRKEDIDNGIWSDPDFEALSLEATCLYLWSFTNPRCGMAGIYKVSHRAMTESKVPADRLDDALAELAQAGFCFYERGVLYVRTRAKHLRQKTEQIAKSIRSDVAKLPEDHPLRARFLADYSSAIWLRHYLTSEALATVTQGSAEGQGSSAPGRYKGTLPRRSHDRLGKGQRQGNGKGPSREGVQGEGFDWRAYAQTHLPDLPESIVCITAIRLAGGGHEFTPEELREHVRAAHPALTEEEPLAPVHPLPERAA
jgi:hypothetical protein